MAGTLIAGTIGDGSKSASVSNMIDSRIEARVAWDGSNNILFSTNVSSVTDIGKGCYSINFSKVISNANYTVAGIAQRAPQYSDVFLSVRTSASGSHRTTSRVELYSFDAGGTAVPTVWNSVAIIV